MKNIRIPFTSNNENNPNKPVIPGISRIVIYGVIGMTALDLLLCVLLFYSHNVQPENVRNIAILLATSTILTAIPVTWLCRSSIIDAYKYRALYAEEKDIREKMENYKLILENQSEGVAIVDTEETVLFANKMADEIFGVEQGRLLGRTFDGFLDSVEKKKHIAQVNLRKLGFSDQYEIKVKCDDGKIKALRVTATPKFNESAQYQGSFIVFSDATELKNIESRLSESTAYLRALIESIPQMIWLKDKKLRYVMANHRFVEAVGKDEELEIIGKTDSEMVSEDLAASYNEIDERVLELKQPQTIIEESVKNNKPFWTETVKTPILDKNGEFIGISGITTDISERMESEMSIRKARDFYLLLFENFPVMIWMTNYLARSRVVMNSYGSHRFRRRVGHNCESV